MGILRMSNADEVTMRLVHYFVTKENYQPIVVNGLENEFPERMRFCIKN